MTLAIVAIIVIVAVTFTYFSSNSETADTASSQAVEKSNSTAVKDEAKNTNKTDITTHKEVSQSTTKNEGSPTKTDVTEEHDVEIAFVEGSHYITKFPNEQSDGPIIVEFFSYMCPHCYNFEPTVTRWLLQKPDSITLLKVPVTFGQGTWRLAAKSYYIAEELKMADTFSAAMFKKIHIENKPPKTENDLRDIFTSLGITSANFKKAASSFSVDSKLRKADFLAKKYKVTGVPYFLINYKYEMGAASYESEEALFRLWNHLPGKDFK